MSIQIYHLFIVDYNDDFIHNIIILLGRIDEIPDGEIRPDTTTTAGRRKRHRILFVVYNTTNYYCYCMQF